MSKHPELSSFTIAMLLDEIHHRYRQAMVMATGKSKCHDQIESLKQDRDKWREAATRALKNE